MRDINRFLIGAFERCNYCTNDRLHSINVISLSSPLSDQVSNVSGNNLRVFVDL